MEDTGNNNFTSDTNVEQYQLPVVYEQNQKSVKKSFWKKFGRVAGLIPFAPELLSAYYCSIDTETPARVRAILLAALAYFILPADLIPDFIIGLGFSDDATVLTAAIGIVAGHITDAHKSQANSIIKQLAGDDV
jgi:uncharacterized membrane protein YkvA (DUF1232 family)